MSGQKAFYNKEHGSVFRTHGWNSSGKADRQRVVEQRYKILEKEPKAMLVQVKKVQNSVEFFFRKPGGAGARGWMKPDAANPTSLASAKELLTSVQKHAEIAQQKLKALVSMHEEALETRRIKCFELQKRDLQATNVLAYEKVRSHLHCPPSRCLLAALSSLHLTYAVLSCVLRSNPRPTASSTRERGRSFAGQTFAARRSRPSPRTSGPASSSSCSRWRRG